MGRKYTPRRAGKRWQESAPAYVLDCFDDKGDGDRYTVFFTGEFLITDGTFKGTHVPYLGMSEHLGISQWGELDAYQCANYRYAKKHRRVRWLDLPDQIRKHVIARAAED